MSPFVVVYDSNVLHPSCLRDLLIRVAQAGLVQAKWTDKILDETFDSVRQRFPDIDQDQVDRIRRLMCTAVRDCLVTGYEPLIESLHLPDPDDRHVVAAAIRARAQVIVTSNLKEFPDEVLHEYDMEAKSPDDFMIDQFHLDSLAVHLAVQRMADARTKPPASFNDVLDMFEASGLVASAALLRR